MIIDCFGVRYLAKIYGALFPTLLIGAGMGAIVGGLCADWLGTYRPAFAGLAALNVVALVLVKLLRRERILNAQEI